MSSTFSEALSASCHQHVLPGVDRDIALRGETAVRRVLRGDGKGHIFGFFHWDSSLFLMGSWMSW